MVPMRAPTYMQALPVLLCPLTTILLSVTRSWVAINNLAARCAVVCRVRPDNTPQAETDDWLSVFVMHQNRVQHGPQVMPGVAGGEGGVSAGV
jgi:hypothetical protein